MSPETKTGKQQLAVPSKRMVKWTKEDNDLLKELVSSEKTSTIAEKFQRSTKSIHQRMIRLGISPYDNDGRYTMAELSRYTGIPRQTLIRYAQLGKISGAFRVGRYWRVEWDGQTTITPSWHGHSLHKEQLGDTPRETCAFCGTTLQSPDIFYCSKRCQGLYTSQLYREKLNTHK